MAFPRKEQGPPRLTAVPLFGNLRLENSFEDNGVAGQHVLDLLLKDDVFQRCPTAQLDPTALQRSNRGKRRPLLASRTAAAGPDPQAVV